MTSPILAGGGTPIEGGELGAVVIAALVLLGWLFGYGPRRARDADLDPMFVRMWVRHAGLIEKAAQSRGETRER